MEVNVINYKSIDELSWTYYWAGSCSLLKVKKFKHQKCNHKADLTGGMERIWMSPAWLFSLMILLQIIDYKFDLLKEIK